MSDKPASNVAEVLFEKIHAILQREVESGVASDDVAQFVCEFVPFAYKGAMASAGLLQLMLEELAKPPVATGLSHVDPVAVREYLDSLGLSGAPRKSTPSDPDTVSFYASLIAALDGNRSGFSDPDILDQIAKEALHRGLPVDEALVSVFAKVFGPNTAVALLIAVAAKHDYLFADVAKDCVPPNLFSLLRISLAKLVGPTGALDHVAAEFEARYPGYRYAPNVFTLEFPAPKAA